MFAVSDRVIKGMLVTLQMFMTGTLLQTLCIIGTNQSEPKRTCDAYWR